MQNWLSTCSMTSCRSNAVCSSSVGREVHPLLFFFFFVKAIRIGEESLSLPASDRSVQSNGSRAATNEFGLRAVAAQGSLPYSTSIDRRRSAAKHQEKVAVERPFSFPAAVVHSQASVLHEQIDREESARYDACVRHSLVLPIGSLSRSAYGQSNLAGGRSK